MGVVDEAVRFIRSLKGVVGVREMDDEVSEGILRIEKSIRTKTDNEYDNVGYRMTMEEKHRLVVFYNDDLKKDIYTVLKMVDIDGTVLGTSLLEHEIPSFRDRQDILWISEDFVMFTNIAPKGEPSFKLYPFVFHSLMENVPGCRNAIGASPTPSSDLFIKERFDMPADQRIFTVVIGFDE